MSELVSIPPPEVSFGKIFKKRNKFYIFVSSVKGDEYGNGVFQSNHESEIAIEVTGGIVSAQIYLGIRDEGGNYSEKFIRGMSVMDKEFRFNVSELSGNNDGEYEFSIKVHTNNSPDPVDVHGSHFVPPDSNNPARYVIFNGYEVRTPEPPVGVVVPP